MADFLWLVILGGFVCAFMAWGIGANDVANSFSTSVGSKAITLRQAVLIAAVFEFLGALLLGSEVVDTIRKKITDYDYFEHEEDLLMLGMFCALLSSGLWLLLASIYALPVSTSQTIIGSLVGFVLVEKGQAAIQWTQIWEIIMFWFLTPLMAGVSCVAMYWPLRRFLLRRYDSYQQTLKTWPLFVFLVVFIMSIFIMLKGMGRFPAVDNFSLGNATWISALVGIVVTLLTWLLLVRTGRVERFVDRRVNAKLRQKPKYSNHKSMSSDKEMTLALKAPRCRSESEDKILFSGYKSLEAGQDPVQENDDFESQSHREPKQSMFSELQMSVKRQVMHGVDVDIHAGLTKREQKLQSQKENFDPYTEEAFAWLQVCTACLASLAHGSNDVANAVAPFAAMIGLYEHGLVTAEVDVPVWILAVGGVGIVVGLCTFGYRVIQTLGVKTACMSCTRGYCMELSSAVTVVLASYYGYPVSTTHAKVGSVVGCGLCELSRPDGTLSIHDVINWKLLLQIAIGWIFTIVISGGTSAVLFSLMAYSPASKGVCMAMHHHSNATFN